MPSLLASLIAVSSSAVSTTISRSTAIDAPDTFPGGFYARLWYRRGTVWLFEDFRYRVGPESAGANPGPACYRRGGPLTVTDCNVVLGKLQPEHFPAVFGPDADETIDVEAVRAGFEAMASDVESATGARPTAQAVAEGFFRLPEVAWRLAGRGATAVRPTRSRLAALFGDRGSRDRHLSR